MKWLLAFLAVLAFSAGASADMYQDGSNAALPAARTNQAIAPHVATNAALTAAAATTYPSGVWRDDFAAGRGALPLWYLPSGSRCSLASGAGDNGSQVKSADNKCWLAVFPAAGVTPLQWGAKGGGTTDDTVPLQAAFNAMAGKTLLQGNNSYFIGNDLFIPEATTLKGPFGKIGAVAVSHSASIPYANYPSLRIASSAHFTPRSSAAIDGVLLYRAGMTFPATNSSAFAGIGVNVGGDNVTVRNSLIMGFNQGISSVGYSRGTIEDMSFDNQANILVQNSTDTWQVAHIHAWPFASDSPTMSAANWARTGANFKIVGSNDATMISHYFSWGYLKGFVFADNQGATCTNCDADNNLGGGSHGFEITGTTAGDGTTLIAPQAFINDVGIYRSDTGSNAVLKIVDGSIVSNAQGLVLDGGAGTTKVQNTDFGNNINSIVLKNDTSALFVNNSIFSDQGGAWPITSTINTASVFIGANNKFPDGTTGDSHIFISGAVPSASVLALPGTGSTFAVVNGASFADLTGAWAGRVVTLYFTDALSILVNTPGTSTITKMHLKGGTNYSPPSGSAITFFNAGNGPWVEVSRQ